MDRTVVLAVALGIGALLLWSLLILLEDMRGGRGKKRPARPAADQVAQRRPPPRPVQWADTPPPPPVSAEFDDRFEQLVDEWLGSDERPSDDPWRRSA